MNTTPPALTVYFDGLCRLCSAEIAHYQRLPEGKQISFVDITSPHFSPASEGLDPVMIHKAMHVRDQSGALHVGVDAFLEIWKIFPRYRFLATLASSRLVRPLLKFGYAFFAAIRPYLPRKTAGCETSPYCELPKRNA